LEIGVISEQGEPVPGALIYNGPPAEDDTNMAGIETKKTDEAGVAVFEIWAIAEYMVRAHWVGNGIFRESDVVTIPPGEGAVKITIKLRKPWGVSMNPK
jgi:hypothetical protein